MVKNILEALVNVSEKAANIARAFRQNEHLFGLLVQEKCADDGANSRFVHDYKTLADVLIQETIRHDVGALVSCWCWLCSLGSVCADGNMRFALQFPEVRANIRGEENGTFTNTLGDSADVRVADDAAETVDGLLKLLDGDAMAAELIAQEVHRNVVAPLDEDVPDMPMEGFNFANMGIWVDPIGAY